MKVLTAGAFKSTVVALVPEYEEVSGNTVVVDNDTAGALAKRIDAGETFDAVVTTPAAIDELFAKGKVAPGSRVDLARVGVMAGPVSSDRRICKLRNFHLRTVVLNERRHGRTCSGHPRLSLWNSNRRGWP
jgi:hypothetical protein